MPSPFSNALGPRLSAGLALLACALACATPAPESEAPSPSSPAARSAAPATQTVTIIGLTDFHGWLSPLKPRKRPEYYGGIANIAAMLAEREKVSGETAILVDNGDMWTGQTAATLLEGEPVVHIYNLMGFAAVNVANHEFDFGVEALRARVAQAKFPFLGANIFIADTDEQPDFVRPWKIVERSGVKVGIIGLSYIDTPKTTLAANVKTLDFHDYARTLERELPRLRAAGAEVVALLLHDEMQQGVELLRSNPGLRVDLVIAGQNHRKERAEVRGIPIVNPGAFGRSYVRFDVRVDAESRRVLDVRDETVAVGGLKDAPPYPPPAEITKVIAAANKLVENQTAEQVGTLGQPLPTGTFNASPLGHFVVDSWLEAFPMADFAMVNHGGLRQNLESGAVSMGDLLGAMPFENNIRQLKLTGAQVKSQLAIDHPVVGGLTWRYRDRNNRGREIVAAVDRVGKPIADDRFYAVLIIDFMYTGGDGYEFQRLDPNPVDTGLSWREPLIRALRNAEARGRPVTVSTAPRGRKVR